MAAIKVCDRCNWHEPHPRPQYDYNYVLKFAFTTTDSGTPVAGMSYEADLCPQCRGEVRQAIYEMVKLVKRKKENGSE